MSDRHAILAWFERGRSLRSTWKKSLPATELSRPLTAKWVKRDDNRLKSP